MMTPKNENRIVMLFVCILIAGVLSWLGMLAWIIGHFINKYW